MKRIRVMAECTKCGEGMPESSFELCAKCVFQAVTSYQAPQQSARTVASIRGQVMIKVYIASSYTADPIAGVRAQIDAFDAIRNAGMFPFAPLLGHFVHDVHPRSYEDWMTQDWVWIGACDALVRLPGESPGADREVEYAKQLGRTVYFGLDELFASPFSTTRPM